ncbi:hypothetical protein TU77_16345 [Pseudomonas synxantha]|nr:hypothetical protein TU77_16345 [Pseudomonas synxantha]
MGLVFESGEIFSGGIAMVIVGFIFIFFDLFDYSPDGQGAEENRVDTACRESNFFARITARN